MKVRQNLHWKEKMKEKSQSNTNRKAKSKRASPIGAEDCLFSFRTIPITEAMVEKWAHDLKQWIIDNPNAKTLTQFFLAKGLRQETYNRLVKKFDVLAEAHENAKRELGERLWGRAVDRQAEWKPVHFMLHNYAPEFDEANKYHNILKESIASATGMKLVEYEKFPDSDLVPKRKK